MVRIPRIKGSSRRRTTQSTQARPPEPTIKGSSTTLSLQRAEGNALCFGDDILLRCTSSERGAAAQGYVCGMRVGVHRTKLRVLDLVSGQPSVACPPDTRACMFQFHPKLPSVDSETPHQQQLRMDELQRKSTGETIAFGCEVQLWHAHTNMYLSTTSVCAEGDTRLLQLVLAPCSSASVFVVMPAFKVSTVGELVDYRSALVLRAHKKNVAVHHSALGGSLLQEELSVAHQYVSSLSELTGSAYDQTIFRICPFRRARSPGLLAGCTLSLYHTESEAQLSAHQPAIQSSEDTVRLKPVVSELDLNSLWRVESSELEWGGVGLRSNQDVRLKHVHSQLYLVARPTGELTLSDRYSDAAALWRLQSARDGDEDVALVAGRKVFLQHVSTRFWLSSNAGVGLKAVPAVSEGDTFKIRGPLPDGMIRNLITADNFVDAIRDACRALAELEQPLTDPNTGGINKRSQHGISTHLQPLHLAFLGMCQGCADQGDPTSGNTAQALYGSLGAIAKTIQLAQRLWLPSELAVGQDAATVHALASPQDPEIDITAVGKALFSFLGAVVTNCTDNQQLLAEHKGVLQELLLLPYGVVDTYAALFRNNKTLSERLDHRDVEHLVGSLEELHKSDRLGSRAVMLLNMLCSCNGVPIVSNQNSVLQLLLVRHPQLLVGISEAGGVLHDMLPGHEGTIEARRFTKQIASNPAMLSCELSKCSYQQRMFRYQLQLLRLYSTLCLGRNRQVIDWLLTREARTAPQRGKQSVIELRRQAISGANDPTERSLGLRYDDLLSIVSNESLPAVYRSAYCDMIIRLYVDRDPFQPIVPLSNIRVAYLAKPPKQHLKLPDPYQGELKALRPPDKFPDLVRWIISFLKATREETRSLGARGTHSVFLEAVFKLTHNLLAMGVFHDERGPLFDEIRPLVDLSLDHLDSRNDEPRLTGCTEQSAPLLEARLWITKILEFAFDCRQEKRVSVAFSKYEQVFKESFGSDASSFRQMEPSPLVVKGDPEDGMAMMSMSSGGRSLTQQYLTTPALWDERPPWSSYEFDSLSTDLFETPILSPRVAALCDYTDVPEFASMLLDSVHCGHAPLRNAALALLIRHYAQRSVMVTTMVNTQCIVYPEVGFLLEEVKQAIAGFRQQIKFLESDDANSSCEAFTSMHADLGFLTSLVTLGSRVRAGAQDVVVTKVEVGKFQSMFGHLGAHKMPMSVLEKSLPVAERIQRASLRVAWDQMVDAGFLPDRSIGDAGLLNAVWRNMLKDFGMSEVPTLLGLSAQRCPRPPRFRQPMNFDGFWAWWASACPLPMPFLFSSIYKFLAAFCDSNKKNQDLLAPQLDLFRAHQSTAWVHSSLLLSSLFRNHSSLCKNIPEPLVEASVMQLLSSPPEEATLISDFLETTLCCSGKRNKRASHLVMKHLVKSWQIKLPTTEEFFVADATALRRIALFLYLVGACCQGEAPEHEATAQAILSYEGLLEFVLDERAAVKQKAASSRNKDTGRVAVLLHKELSAAALAYFHEVFVECGSSVAMDKVKRGNRLFAAPQKSITDQLAAGATKAPLSLMTFCEAVIRASIAACKAVKPNEPKTREYTAQSELLWRGVIPTITAYFRDVYRPDPVRLQTCKKIASAVSDLLSVARKHRGLMGPTQTAALLAALAALSPGTVSDREIESAANPKGKPVDAQESMRAVFAQGWSKYSLAFAGSMGIKDVSRAIGPGMRGLAWLCTGDQVPGTNFTFQSVVQQMLSALQTQISGKLAQALLRITRMAVYLDDPNDPEGELQDLNWDLMIADKPPVKKPPSVNMLSWVQNKVLSLGAAAAVLCSISNPDPAHNKAALRLGVALLEGGNQDAQEAFLSSSNFDQAPELWERFPLALSNHLKSCSEAIADWKVSQLRQVTDDEGAGRDSIEHASAFDTAILLARFLQLLCEGHCIEGQDFLRMQRASDFANRNINLLLETVGLLRVLSAAVPISVAVRDCKTLAVLEGILTFLTETVLGPCQANQECLCASDLPAVITSLFTSLDYETALGKGDILDEDFVGDINRIKTALSALLIGLIEGASPGSVAKLAASMSLSCLTENIQQLMHPCSGVLAQVLRCPEQLGNPLAEVSSDFLDTLDSMVANPSAEGSGLVSDLHQEALSCLLVLRYFEESYPRAAYELESLQQWNELVLVTGLERWCGRCEINRDDFIYAVHYLPPRFALELQQDVFLAARTEKHFQTVSRGNPAQKALDMVQVLTQLVLTNEHQREIRSFPVISGLFSATVWTAIDNLSFSLSIAIVAMLFLFYGHKSDPFGDYSGTLTVTAMLSFCHLIFATLFVVVYFLAEAPLYVKQSSVSGLFVHQTVRWASEEPPEAETKSAESFFSKAWAALTLTASPLWWYHLAYWGVSMYCFTGFMHTNYTPWFWHALLLMHIFRRSSGKKVLESLVKGGPTLWKTAKVGVAVLVLFGTISFVYFETQITIHNDCETAFQCMFLGIDQGIRGDLAGMHGNDFGDIFDPFPLKVSDEQIMQAQWWTVIVFFIFWDFIFAGIIQGQIVDAFSEIRSIENSNLEDSLQFCLVCSLDRYTLEKDAPGGFWRHTTVTHSPWNYLLYLQSIRDTNPEDFTGMQTYVCSLLAEGSADFIPVSRCCDLQGAAADESDSMESLMGLVLEKIDGLEQSVSGIKQRMDSVVTREDPDTAPNRDRTGSHPQPRGRRGFSIDEVLGVIGVDDSGEDGDEGQEFGADGEAEHQSGGIGLIDI